MLCGRKLSRLGSLTPFSETFTSHPSFLVRRVDPVVRCITDLLHYPATLAVNTFEDGSETKTCIDGKQRLTSIHRFVIMILLIL